MARSTSVPLHTVKYARAKALADTGRYPSTFDAIWRMVPNSLRADLPARHLATIVDLMREQHTRGEYRGWLDAKEARDA